MPAALRGGERSSAKPRSKSSAGPSGARAGGKGQASQPAAKLSAARGLGLSPRAALIAVSLVLGAGLVVALATGGRAQKAVTASSTAVAGQFGNLGLRLTTVRLQGASPAASDDILRAAALQRGDPLLGLDLAAVRARVEQVGWVKSAKVVRLLPDTLVIDVQERRLLAVWQHAGASSVIDADGVVAPDVDPARFASLPLVVGEGANAAAGAILPAVIAHPRVMQRLEALVRVDQRRWDLRLKDGSIIQLPASDEQGALIRLDQLDQRSRILELGFSRIDLRDPELVAVRPRETGTAPGVVGGVG